MRGDSSEIRANPNPDPNPDPNPNPNPLCMRGARVEIRALKEKLKSKLQESDVSKTGSRIQDGATKNLEILTSQLKEAGDAIKASNDAISSLEDQLRQSHGENTELEEQLRQFSHENMELRTKLKEVSSAFASFENQTKTRVNEESMVTESRVTESESRVIEAESRVNELSQALRESESRRIVIREELIEAGASIKGLYLDAQISKEVISSAEAKSLSLQEDLTMSKLQVAEVTALGVEEALKENAWFEESIEHSKTISELRDKVT